MALGRRVVFAGLTTLLVVGAVELAALLGLHALEARRPGSVVEIFVDNRFSEIEPEDHARFVAGAYFAHDADLGWVTVPGGERVRREGSEQQWSAHIDARGARNDPNSAGPEKIATYGDSFTFGSELEDEQTWPAQLGRTLGVRVVNYGVPAWSAYQALLRFERHAEEGRTYPITVLGVHESNLLRSANLYRPFLAPGQRGSLGTRPALRVDDDGVQRLPNPWPDPSWELDQIREAVMSAADDDAVTRYWTRLRAPFTWQLLKRALPGDRGAREDLWNSPEGHAIMDAIVSGFLEVALRAGTRPVVVLFPTLEELDQSGAPPYAAWRNGVRNRHPGLRLVDLAEAGLEPTGFSNLRGHPSRAGARRIAGVLAPVLAPLVTEGSPAAPARSGHPDRREADLSRESDRHLTDDRIHGAPSAHRPSG